MSIPLRQQFKVGSYLVKQRLLRRQRYPLVLMLEPLFRCNLACAGCGKIDYPDSILRQRMSVDDCLEAARECGAPIVSIPGGEPLLHKEIGDIVAGLIKLKRFVYLCTNALLLEKKLHLFKPSPYLTFSIHLDGEREEHDHSVCQKGVFDRVVKAMDVARQQGFRMNVNCTLFNNVSSEKTARFFDYATDHLKVDGITVSPGYAYERAPDQEHFLKRERTRNLFRQIFRAGERRGRRRRWPLSHSALYLDFLAGNRSYRCMPWGNPTRNIFGWQRPCYLLGEGYAPSFKALMEETDWDLYGTGNYEKCANCMAHCGYEAPAVSDMFSHPLRALKTALSGVRTSGAMADDISLKHQRPADYVFSRNVADFVNRLHAPSPSDAKDAVAEKDNQGNRTSKAEAA